MLMLESTLAHVSCQCEFVPVLSIDPGKLYYCSEQELIKTMVKLEFGALARC